MVKGLEFWGIEPAEVDETVKVWYDPSLKKSASKAQHGQNNEVDSNGQPVIGNELKNMGLNSAMNKDERLFHLVSEWQRGNINTVQDAMESLMLSKSTITSYLKKDLNWRLLDTDRNKYVGGENDEPTASHLGTGDVVYFDNDPSSGGKQVSKLQFKTDVIK